MRRLLVVLLVVATVACAYCLDLGRHVSREGMQAMVDAAGPWAPVLFMALCIAGIFMHLPEIVVVALGGMALGGMQAFAYGWLACVIGATATFLIVRYLARDYFQRVLVARFARLRALDERLENNGFRTVLLLRLLLFMAPPLNWVLGATRVRLQHYVAGTALGVLPGMAAAVVFGEVIATESSDEGLSLRTVGSALLVIAFICTVTFASRKLLGRGPSVPQA